MAEVNTTYGDNLIDPTTLRCSNIWALPLSYFEGTDAHWALSLMNAESLRVINPIEALGLVFYFCESIIATRRDEEGSMRNDSLSALPKIPAADEWIFLVELSQLFALQVSEIVAQHRILEANLFDYAAQRALLYSPGIYRSIQNFSGTNLTNALLNALLLTSQAKVFLGMEAISNAKEFKAAKEYQLLLLDRAVKWSDVQFVNTVLGKSSPNGGNFMSPFCDATTSSSSSLEACASSATMHYWSVELSMLTSSRTLTELPEVTTVNPLLITATQQCALPMLQALLDVFDFSYDHQEMMQKEIHQQSEGKRGEEATHHRRRFFRERNYQLFYLCRSHDLWTLLHVAVSVHWLEGLQEIVRRYFPALFPCCSQGNTSCREWRQLSQSDDDEINFQKSELEWALALYDYSGKSMLHLAAELSPGEDGNKLIEILSWLHRVLNLEFIGHKKRGATKAGRITSTTTTDASSNEEAATKDEHADCRSQQNLLTYFQKQKLYFHHEGIMATPHFLDQKGRSVFAYLLPSVPEKKRSIASGRKVDSSWLEVIDWFIGEDLDLFSKEVVVLQKKRREEEVARTQRNDETKRDDLGQMMELFPLSKTTDEEEKEEEHWRKSLLNLLCYREGGCCNAVTSSAVGNIVNGPGSGRNHPLMAYFQIAP